MANGMVCPHCDRWIPFSGEKMDSLIYCEYCGFQMYTRYPLTRKTKEYVGQDGIYENRKYVVLMEPHGHDEYYGLYRKTGTKCNLIKMSAVPEELVEEAKRKGVITRWEMLDLS